MTGSPAIDATFVSIASISSSPSSSSISSFPVTRCPTAYCEGGETPQGPELPAIDRAMLAARYVAQEERKASVWARHRPRFAVGLDLHRLRVKEAANVNHSL